MSELNQPSGTFRRASGEGQEVQPIVFSRGMHRALTDHSRKFDQKPRHLRPVWIVLILLIPCVALTLYYSQVVAPGSEETGSFLPTTSYALVLLLLNLDLIGLVVLGLLQTRARKAKLARVVTLPVAMGGLSLYGTVSAFGHSPAVLLAWALALGAVVAISLRQSAPATARYHASRREFDLPGSWVPMVLILGIFLTKYAVGVATAMQPALRADPAFALPVAVLYGVFSGVFAGRTLGLLRLARPRHATGSMTLRTTA